MLLIACIVACGKKEDKQKSIGQTMIAFLQAETSKEDTTSEIEKTSETEKTETKSEMIK